MLWRNFSPKIVVTSMHHNSSFVTKKLHSWFLFAPACVRGMYSEGSIWVSNQPKRGEKTSNTGCLDTTFNFTLIILYAFNNTEYYGMILLCVFPLCLTTCVTRCTCFNICSSLKDGCNSQLKHVGRIKASCGISW